MSDRTERVLAVLDAGLQSSDETGFGTDLDPDLCARCRDETPMDRGDLCAGCRAFLLGDTDQDPTAGREAAYLAATVEVFRRAVVASGVTMEAVVAGIRHRAEEEPRA